ncbi:2335_t:CDS:1, partial [Entrophospora sp. SA101]
ITSLSFPNIKIKQENQITYQNHDDNNYRNVKNISASSSDSSSPPSPSNSSTIINSNITTKMPINTQRTTRRQNLSTPSLIRPSAAQMPSPDTSPCVPTLKYQHQMHQDILQIPLHTGRYCQYQQVIQPFTHIFPIPCSTLPPYQHQQQQQERNLTAQTKSQSTIPDIECRKRKLERNRIAAKQCRERKKIYVAKLESKVTRLEEENAHLRRELDELNTRLQFNP